LDSKLVNELRKLRHVLFSPFYISAHFSPQLNLGEIFKAFQRYSTRTGVEKDRFPPPPLSPHPPLSSHLSRFGLYVESLVSVGF
jgi:hypothetical protein